MVGAASVEVGDDPGPPTLVGLPLGGIYAKDEVALADVQLNDDPLREAEILLEEPLNEFDEEEALEKLLLNVEFGKGAVVDDREKEEVRFAGRLVTILVEDVAEVDSVVLLDDTDDVICILVTVDRIVEF